MKNLYPTQVTATGGREGRARSHDGHLEVALAIPKDLGGPGWAATNPEQLFGAGYAACFESALRFVARTKKVSIVESRVTATVGLSARPEGGFKLNVGLSVGLPGLEASLARDLIAAAHETCPYSNAVRGNIDVAIELE